MSGYHIYQSYWSQFVKTGPAGCGCAVAKNGETLYEGYFRVCRPGREEVHH